ncbi:exodeoxyribonuclease III [Telmatospirillum siberiense]|uniref:Exodeoxyribonuclease III n=1 Tax=Telmatospirillum siberiense TaxID=382514 RepID=A0A2N3PTC7_9PROT|nr:exodeoxyribonuclease III [Telmatospirillum siberiense]PKU23636.1 exodeoxyribonuclease III [Telmatospirillum siberiense]
MKIATWNVNSVKARLGAVLDWLQTAKPDVLLLQEIKCVDADFPRLELESLGWHLAVRGQKTYNGVAVLSRLPIIEEVREMAGDGGEARYIEAKLANGVRVASIYVPMGQSTESDRFPFKLAFLDAVRERARRLMELEEPFVLGGDYNVAPEEADVFDVHAMEGQVLFHPEERQRFRRLLYLGLTDAFRAFHSEAHCYSWWDYRAGAWQRDLGLRIDHLLLSPQAADRLVASGIDREPRGREKCSDHTPVWCELSD